MFHNQVTLKSLAKFDDKTREIEVHIQKDVDIIAELKTDDLAEAEQFREKYKAERFLWDGTGYFPFSIEYTALATRRKERPEERKPIIGSEIPPAHVKLKSGKKIKRPVSSKKKSGG